MREKEPLETARQRAQRALIVIEQFWNDENRLDDQFPEMNLTLLS